VTQEDSLSKKWSDTEPEDKSLFMCCKFVKWITVVVAVKILINRYQIQNAQLITIAETRTRDIRTLKMMVCILFILNLSVGVRPTPLGAQASSVSFVLSLDDIWICSSQWNKNWQWRQKYSEKVCPTTNPIWSDLGSSSSRRGGKSASNRLS
jgi:hypothetical protein